MRRLGDGVPVGDGRRPDCARAQEAAARSQRRFRLRAIFRARTWSFMSSSTASTITARHGKRPPFRLLNETTTGAMYEAMLPRVFDLLLPRVERGFDQRQGADRPVFGTWRARVCRRNQPRGGHRAAAMFRPGHSRRSQRVIRELADRLLRRCRPAACAVRDIQKSGRTIHQFDGASAAGIDRLVVRG